MTEDEAKSKWCPFSRTAAPVDSEFSGTAGNRTYNGTHSVDNCIGSACMAWRLDNATGLKIEKHEQGHTPEGKFWVKNTCTEGPTGYCGLAGKP